jgi:uroporphyrin-III C-methyltransferase/precorrin-2 dehydrogenase/sirohydrochlorin ferrochelatase
MTYIPLFFSVRPEDRIVIVGGGQVALAKLEALRSAASSLRIVAREAVPALQETAQKYGAELIIAPYQKRHLADARLVIAATDDAALNRQVHADAKAAGITVNVVDTPELCDVIFPAVVQRGDIQIAISTSGISPTLARSLKRRIEQLLPWNMAWLGEWLDGKRATVRNKIKGIPDRRLFWDAVIEGPIPQEILEGNSAKAESLFAAALASHTQPPRVALYLIGAGPGHPDLITVRGAQLLGLADVILYDRLIPAELLSRYGRRDAEKIPVGKSRDTHGKTQQEIDSLLERHLRENRIVARLKGGDPGIYAHAAEEIAVASRLKAPWQIVPGITAALGCAASAGIPLTERGGALGVRFLTLYDETLHDEAFWQSMASSKKETLAFYMSTRHSALLCERLLAGGFDPATPLLVVEQGTTPGHTEYEATLGNFAERYGNFAFITPTLIIVGDVVCWRAEHGWKEAPKERRRWFAAAQREKAHAGG